MSEEDIDKAVKEAAQFEAEDKKKKDAVDTRNEADSAVFQIEKALEEAGDKITADEKANVEADLNALKDALAKAPIDSMTDDQVDEIKAAKEKLMTSAQTLFTKMYENMQQSQPGGGADSTSNAGGTTSGGSDDDVVDADYKEI